MKDSIFDNNFWFLVAMMVLDDDDDGVYPCASCFLMISGLADG